MARIPLRLEWAHFIRATAVTLCVSMCVSAAQAQDTSPGFLDNLFNRGEPPRSGAVPQGQSQQTNDNELAIRLDRMENALRQLTGTVEQLQYRNQQLEMQLKRMQDDAEYRFQQLGTKGAVVPGAIPAPMNAPAAVPDRRGDAFDPAQHPNAPGAPRILGDQSAALPPQNADNAPPIGTPGRRPTGAPLDLSTAASNATEAAPNSRTLPAAMQPPPQLPPPQNQNVGVGRELATLPPSARPQDEYDLAYGYVLHKDYALAEQAFRDFLAKYPNERLLPDAQYWLGEALFQQQRYREAAESFLSVSTKYDQASKAPDSLLRLGQSLAALQKKDAACATFAEINRKYPRASASVKRGAAQELKRAHC